jgi:hypothetical protein
LRASLVRGDQLTGHFLIGLGVENYGLGFSLHGEH